MKTKYLTTVQSFMISSKFTVISVQETSTKFWKSKNTTWSYPRHAIINCQHRVSAPTRAIQIHLQVQDKVVFSKETAKQFCESRRKMLSSSIKSGLARHRGLRPKRQAPKWGPPPVSMPSLTRARHLTVLHKIKSNRNRRIDTHQNISIFINCCQRYQLRYDPLSNLWVHRLPYEDYPVP